MTKDSELTVHIAKDDETGIWYIAQSDIPGLRLEADTVSGLIRKIEDVAPDLIELNAAEIEGRQRPSALASRAPRRTMSIRPVFDSPMAIAS